MQKKRKVSCDYKPNRLANSHLADTYEKLLPRNKYKVRFTTETNKKSEIEIKQTQGINQ